MRGFRVGLYLLLSGGSIAALPMVQDIAVAQAQPLIDSYASIDRLGTLADGEADAADWSLRSAPPAESFQPHEDWLEQLQQFFPVRTKTPAWQPIVDGRMKAGNANLSRLIAATELPAAAERATQRGLEQ